MNIKITKNILVLGYFGFKNNGLSGQSVKTRVCRDLLNKYYTKGQVDYFDTQTLNKWGNIPKLMLKICKCDILFYLPAQKNLKYLFPLYFILSKIFRFQIVYSVIGGWLVSYLKTKPLHRWMLKRIKVVLSETSRMKKDLQKEYRFTNVDVLHNFRITDFDAVIEEHKELKLVFMARIDPMKGLDTIFNFCHYISSMDTIPNITIDFYGPFNTKEEEKYFKEEINKYKFVKYHGVLNPEEIYDKLVHYDLLMLPTHYYTEGLPGTIIDSYISGLPVIVSEWLHAREFVEDGITGKVIPFKNHQEFFNKIIMNFYNDRQSLNILKKGAKNFSNLFTENNAWNKIYRYIN